MEAFQKNWLKFGTVFFVCLLFRLIPIRPPNIEPLLAAQMPFAKAYGAWPGFIFGFFSIVIYDIVTGTLGVWTLITASTYGLLGFLAFIYFKNQKVTAWSFAGFAILGTLFFDAVTGLSIGPLFFGQSFLGALSGQIPFTLWHLLGNVSFAFVLSPAIYNLALKNEKLENPMTTDLFLEKKISNL